jgi:hypothetical protein
VVRQFLLERFGDKLAQWDSSFSGGRLGTAEQHIGDLKSRFHYSHIPILIGLTSLKCHKLKIELPCQNEFHEQGQSCCIFGFD